MPHCDKQMISFFLTTKCNLCCVYCYNIKERAIQQEKTLPLSIAKAGIDYFFNNYSSRHIRFYGPGEPTQEFQLMCQITDYARAQSTDFTVKVEIQTNGVFSKEVRSWMLENINIMWMSFDGPPDIQNDNRPINKAYVVKSEKSADIIEDNIKWLMANRGNRDLMVGARVTVSDKNNNRHIEMIDYFYDLGIRYVWTDPLFPSVGRKAVCVDRKKDYNFDMDAYARNYIEAYKYATKKGLFYGSILTCNFDGETKTHCRTCTPVPHLTPDGYVSACDMVVFGEEAHHMDCFIYGKWNIEKKVFEFDGGKIKALRDRNIDNMPHCKNCEVKQHCGGYCLGEVVNETGSLIGQKKLTCKAIKTIYKSIGTCTTYDYLHP